MQKTMMTRLSAGMVALAMLPMMAGVAQAAPATQDATAQQSTSISTLWHGDKDRDKHHKKCPLAKLGKPHPGGKPGGPKGAPGKHPGKQIDKKDGNKQGPHKDRPQGSRDGNGQGGQNCDCPGK